jgi:hypothetical protein
MIEILSDSPIARQVGAQLLVVTEIEYEVQQGWSWARAESSLLAEWAGQTAANHLETARAGHRRARRVAAVVTLNVGDAPGHARQPVGQQLRDLAERSAPET